MHTRLDGRLLRAGAIGVALLGGGLALSCGEAGDPATTPTGDGGAPVDAGEPEAPTPASEPTISPGAPDRIVLLGTVVTPSEAFEGSVLVEGTTITCVAAGVVCLGRPGAQGATVIDTKAVIAPGLIDTHNHVLFDIFDNSDWLPSKVYANHDEWTKEPRYQAMLDVKQCLVNDAQGKPAWCAETPYGSTTGNLRCEIAKYGELKGLVAGTTSIVGLPGVSSACFASVARSIDVSQNGLGTDKIQTSAIFPPSRASADGVCNNFASNTTAAYLIHCGEGTDALSRAEFATLGSISTTPGCLYAPGTAITHGTSFTATEFAKMGAVGMKLTWSPKSNVALYEATTDIPAALDAGVVVALAPDWSMGGSENLLDETRFAKSWSDAKWGGRLSAKDLVLMSTTNAAKVLALDTRLGRLEEGYLADIAVFTGAAKDPYEAILASRPEDVRLVMIGGRVLYGDESLARAAPSSPPCETIAICGAPKFLCVATTDSANKLDQSYASIVGAIDQALTAADALTPTDGWNFAPVAPLVGCK